VALGEQQTVELKPFWSGPCGNAGRERAFAGPRFEFSAAWLVRRRGPD
jgi:hypothetical protein